MAERIVGFESVYRSDARLLILGSMPSVKSLESGFYYAHPRNCFWSMLSSIFCEREPQSIMEKRRLVMDHHIALWDSVHSCEREGSLDSAIRLPVANDFAALYANCPKLQTVLFNGAVAQKLYRRLVHLPDAHLRFLCMPSTSPAYTLDPKKKELVWAQAIKEALELESL